MKPNVSPALIEYAIGTTDGFGFEKFVQGLLKLRDGDLFVPLGGVKDGGAEGFYAEDNEEIRVSDRKVGTFIQCSKEAPNKVRGKIRGTINRLREFGRNPETLIYWSSRKLSVDVIETELSDELRTVVRVRDLEGLGRLINHGDATKLFFNDFFKAQIDELLEQKQEIDSERTQFAIDPSVYVFLRLENQDKFSKGGLVSPIVDALIYWSLRDTDPDASKLKTRDEICEDIRRVIPGATQTLLPHVAERLLALAKKAEGGEQRVRTYAKQGKYCLPYAMRQQLLEANASEASLQQSVKDSFSRRAEEQGARNPHLVALVCERAIYQHFYNQGLILAAFLEKRLQDISIQDQIVETELLEVTKKPTEITREDHRAALIVLRQVLYTPDEVESVFLRRLSKTSMLLFSLKHCPKLLEYFNQLSGNFRLLIGTDILVKAISEMYLPEEHQTVSNLLLISRQYRKHLMRRRTNGPSACCA